MIEFPGAQVHSPVMEETEQLEELMTCRLDEGRKAVEPCTIVIFGASGDLTARISPF